MLYCHSFLFYFVGYAPWSGIFTGAFRALSIPLGLGLYEDGILSTIDTDKPLSDIDPTKYSDQLEEYYDELVEDVKRTEQIEYIQHLYNLKDQLIGYTRYRA